MANKKQPTRGEMLPKFAAALNCKPAYVNARLLVLGHGVTCGRCGGTGEYSYCQMYGTTCFGCAGRKQAAPKLTEELLARVVEQVAAGELAPYLERLKRRAKVKTYPEKVFAAWRANPTVAKYKGVHFTKQSDRCSSINHFCGPLVDEAYRLKGEVENGRWTPSKPGSKLGSYVRLTDEEVEAALNRLDEIVELAGQAETLAPDVAWDEKAQKFLPILQTGPGKAAGTAP